MSTRVQSNRDKNTIHVQPSKWRQTTYNNYKPVRKTGQLELLKMMKIVFLCLKNSLESRYLSFKSFAIAYFKSEIDWLGEKCPIFYENRPKSLKQSVK
jgi:hypothetical protein